MTNRENPAVGYVLGQCLPVLNSGVTSETFRLWTDDVFDTEASAIEAHAEQVDDEGWCVFRVEAVFDGDAGGPVAEDGAW